MVLALDEKLGIQSRFLDNIPGHAVILDRKQRVIWANNLALKSAGRRLEDVAGRPCYSVWQRAKEPCTGCPVVESIQTGRSSEKEFFAPDGRTYFIKGHPMYDQKKNIIGAYEYAREITERKQRMHEMEQLISSLQKSRKDVRMLSGLLPICSSCKKIRDDRGYWNSLETFFSRHADIDFSHSICPECADRLYGDEDWYRSMKKDPSD